MDMAKYRGLTSEDIAKDPELASILPATSLETRPKGSDFDADAEEDYFRQGFTVPMNYSNNNIDK